MIAFASGERGEPGEPGVADERSVAGEPGEPGELDVYAVSDEMSRRGWSLNGLQNPPAVHICVTLRHAQPGVADRFVADLQASVEAVSSSPGTTGAMAPIYGMTGTVETRATVDELLGRYGDLQFKV